MSKIYTFTDGMFQNIPETMLDEKKASYMENISFDGVKYNNAYDLDLFMSYTLLTNCALTGGSKIVTTASTVTSALVGQKLLLNGVLIGTVDTITAPHTITMLANYSGTKSTGNTLNAITASDYTTFYGVTKIYNWRSSNKFLSASSNDNLIVVKTNTLYFCYYASSKWNLYGTTTATVNGTKLFTAESPNQFVFVDGQDSTKKVRRITINSDGELNIDNIGLDSPEDMAEYNSIYASETATAGTDMPMGVIVQYIHTDVNEFGEESNPSPILSLSNVQGLSRGEVNSRIFEMDNLLSGKTEKVSLTLPVSNSLAKKKYLYRRYAGYSEGNIPATEFTFIGEFPIPENATEITVIDAYSSSGIVANYDRDVAGQADDVIIYNDDTVVLGNVSTDIDFPVEYDQAWEIKLDNRNNSNYVDATIKLNLFDSFFDTTLNDDEYIKLNLSLISDIEDKLVFVHSDRITPLKATINTSTDVVQRFDDIDSNHVKCYYKCEIVIPYIYANSYNSIYLLYNADGFTATQYSGFTNLYNSAPTTIADNNYKPYRVTDESHVMLYRCYKDSSLYGINKYDNNASVNFKNDEGSISESGVQMYAFTDIVGENDFKTNANSFTVPTELVFNSDHNNIAVAGSGSAYLQVRIKAPAPGQESFIYAIGRSTEENYFDVNYSIGLGGEVFIVINARSLAGDLRETDSFYTGMTITDMKWMQLSIMLSFKTTVYDTITPTNSRTEVSYYVVAFKETSTVNEVYSVSFSGTFGTGYGISFKDKNLYYRLNDFDASGSDFIYSGVNVWVNKYYDYNDNGFKRFCSLASYMPDFPIAPLGLFWTTDSFEHDGSYYEHNHNIYFNEITNQSRIKDGYIKFGKQYIPDVNEINVNEKILRLATIPSYLDNQYANTIFAFCTNNIYRITINRDATVANYEVVNELQNVGLRDNKSLAISDRNIYWQSDNGIMQYGKDGIRNLSINKFITNNVSYFYYSADERCIYLYYLGEKVGVYYIDYDKFLYLESSDYRGTDFIGYSGSYDIFCLSKGLPYILGNTTKLTGRIDTGKIQALRGIKRMYSPNTLALTSYLTSDKSLSSASVNSTVTAYQRTMIPNLKSDFVKIKITFDNDFEYLEIDNGGK